MFKFGQNQIIPIWKIFLCYIPKFQTSFLFNCGMPLIAAISAGEQQF